MLLLLRGLIVVICLPDTSTISKTLQTGTHVPYSGRRWLLVSWQASWLKRFDIPSLLIPTGSILQTPCSILPYCLHPFAIDEYCTLYSVRFFLLLASQG